MLFIIKMNERKSYDIKNICMQSLICILVIKDYDNDICYC